PGTRRLGFALRLPLRLFRRFRGGRERHFLVSGPVRSDCSLRGVAEQHRHLTLDPLRRDDDRIGKTFRATSVLAHELVGLFSAGPSDGDLLELLFELRGRQPATLEAITRLDDLLDVELEDVPPAELAVGPFATPEKRPQTSAALPQRQGDLLPDLVVIGD